MRPANPPLGTIPTKAIRCEFQMEQVTVIWSNASAGCQGKVSAVVLKALRPFCFQLEQVRAVRIVLLGATSESGSGALIVSSSDEDIRIYSRRHYLAHNTAQVKNWCSWHAALGSISSQVGSGTNRKAIPVGVSTEIGHPRQRCICLSEA